MPFLGIVSDLSTPNFDLSGSIYIANMSHERFPKVHGMITKAGRVTEALIAEVLDYPWAIPEDGIGDIDVVEVGYPDRTFPPPSTYLPPFPLPYLCHPSLPPPRCYHSPSLRRHFAGTSQSPSLSASAPLFTFAVLLEPSLLYIP